MSLRPRVKNTLDITEGGHVWLNGEELKTVREIKIEMGPGGKLLATITHIVLINKFSSEDVEVEHDSEEIEIARPEVPPIEEPPTGIVQYTDAGTGESWGVDHSKECNGKCVDAQNETVGAIAIDIDCPRHGLPTKKILDSKTDSGPDSGFDGP